MTAATSPAPDRPAEVSGGLGCRHCGLPLPAARRRRSDPFCCLGCRVVYGIAEAAAPAEGGGGGPPSTLLLRLGLGIFLALNIMVASWLGYSGEVFGEAARASAADAALPTLFRYLSLFLCTVSVAILGVPLLREALARAAAGRGVAGRLDTNLLIVLGVLSAYALSVVHTLRGTGSLYFDTAAVLLVVVTLGRHLEARAKRRASLSARRLLAALPTSVIGWRRGVSPESAPEELRLADVEPGDTLLLRAGDVVPADGRVVAGDSHVDEASLTGEALPRPVGEEDRLLAGSLNHDGSLRLRVEKTGVDTVLGAMEQALAAARALRPGLQQLADRVAAVFIPSVALLAVVTFAVWAWRGAPAEGLLAALSVLLISCPCALGLAAPLACWHGLRRAAELGVLVDSPTSLERAAAIDRVYFDKTGTLTRTEGAEIGVRAAVGVDEEWALARAAALATASRHPVAAAVAGAAEHRGVEPVAPPAATRQVAGLGIAGEVEGRRLRLGGQRYVRRCGIALPEAPNGRRGDDRCGDDERGSVFLFDDDRVLARFVLREVPRSDAAEALSRLSKLGVSAEILSGDRQPAAARLGDRLGLLARGDLLPGDKRRLVLAAREEGRRVAMVGDGINDAEVLAAADVGVAIGSASDLAQRSGNVRLLSDRLDRVPLLLELARDVRRRIRLNLGFAFGFNSVGIGFAVSGALNPVLAAIAMVLSSLAVVRISAGAGRAAADRRESAPEALGAARSAAPPLGGAREVAA